MDKIQIEVIGCNHIAFIMGLLINKAFKKNSIL